MEWQEANIGRRDEQIQADIMRRDKQTRALVAAQQAQMSSWHAAFSSHLQAQGLPPPPPIPPIQLPFDTLEQQQNHQDDGNASSYLNNIDLDNN